MTTTSNSSSDSLQNMAYPSWRSKEPTLPSDLPTLCGSCTHPRRFHGDRSVAACDGGTPLRWWMKPGFTIKGRPSVCPCAGYVVDVDNHSGDAA